MRVRVISSRSLLTNIFNLSAILTKSANTSEGSHEPTQVAFPQSTALTESVSAYAGPTTLTSSKAWPDPEQPCEAECLEKMENDVIEAVRR